MLYKFKKKLDRTFFSRKEIVALQPNTYNVAGILPHEYPVRCCDQAGHEDIKENLENPPRLFITSVCLLVCFFLNILVLREQLKQHSKGYPKRQTQKIPVQFFPIFAFFFFEQKITCVLKYCYTAKNVFAQQFVLILIFANSFKKGIFL